MDIERIVGATTVSDVQISPDGEMVAYMTSPASRDGEYPTSQIWLVPADGGTARRIISSEGIDAFPRWSPDGSRIAFLSDRNQRGVPQLYLLDLAGGEAVCLTDRPAGVASAAWSPDGTMLAFIAPGTTSRNRGECQENNDVRVVDAELSYDSLWVVDVQEAPHRNGEQPALRQISLDHVHVGSIQGSNAYAWTLDGTALVAHLADMKEAPDPSDGRLATISLDGEVTHLCEASAVIGPPRFSPDGTTIAFNAADETSASPYALQTVSASGGEPRLCLPGYEGSFLGFAWLPDGRLLSGANIRQRSEFVIVDPEKQEALPAFAPLDQPGTGPYLLSLTSDGHRAAFMRADARSYGDVYVAELGGAPRRLTELNPWLSEASIGELRDAAWVSLDGTEIQGVLALPVDYQSGKRYPALINLRGGPSEASGHGPHASWINWARIMTGRGYAVLIPNYRGSSGRGSEFLRAIVRCGGELEFQDIMAGADWLVEQGIADPEQLVIGGWSYGGYLTAWTVAHTDCFKAAIVGAGITNRISFRGTTDFPSVDDAYFGDLATKAEIRWRASPIRRVRHIRTPTLIVHGENDMRVPVSQGYELYAGLKSAGVETEMVVYPGEGHFIDKREHQIDLLERVVDWYDCRLGRSQTG